MRAPLGRPLVSPRVVVRSIRSRVLLTAVFVALGPAWQTACAGHEATFYPSFYPQEIRIDAMAPAAAASGWPATGVHAYLGADVFDGRPVAANAAAVSSLGSYLVLTFDAAGGRYATGSSNAPARCAAAGALLRALPAHDTSYVLHPYPVTPYHADYLHQFDLAQQARAQYAAPSDARAERPSAEDSRHRSRG